MDHSITDQLLSTCPFVNTQEPLPDCSVEQTTYLLWSFRLKASCYKKNTDHWRPRYNAYFLWICVYLKLKVSAQKPLCLIEISSPTSYVHSNKCVSIEWAAVTWQIAKGEWISMQHTQPSSSGANNSVDGNTQLPLKCHLEAAGRLWNNHHLSSRFASSVVPRLMKSWTTLLCCSSAQMSSAAGVVFFFFFQ